MPDTYQDKYALCYDLIYRDKDYEAECDFVEEIFQEYSPHPIATDPRAWLRDRGACYSISPKRL